MMPQSIFRKRTLPMLTFLILIVLSIVDSVWHYNCGLSPFNRRVVSLENLNFHPQPIILRDQKEFFTNLTLKLNRPLRNNWLVATDVYNLQNGVRVALPCVRGVGTCIQPLYRLRQRFSGALNKFFARMGMEFRGGVVPVGSYSLINQKTVVSVLRGSQTQRVLQSLGSVS